MLSQLRKDGDNGTSEKAKLTRLQFKVIFFYPVTQLKSVSYPRGPVSELSQDVRRVQTDSCTSRLNGRTPIVSVTRGKGSEEEEETGREGGKGWRGGNLRRVR